MSKTGNDGTRLSPRTGSTVVEAMLACFLLVLVSLAGGAYLYHARADISQQRNRRIALEAATGRLEEIRGTAYNLIRPTNLNFNVHYLSQSNSLWFHSQSDPGETITVNGRAVPLTTRVQYVDLDVLSGNTTTPSSYDMMEVRVEAGYRVGSADRVLLQSYYAP